MALTFFKPNKANKGALVSVKFLAKQNKKDEEFKEGCFFFNLVRQVSWNDQSHTGSFKGGEQISVKLTPFEMAKILHVIERNWNLGDVNSMDKNVLKDQYGFTAPHRGEGQIVYINFVPSQRQGATEQTGFGLYITKVVEGQANSSFGVSFPFGDDISLREYIKLGLEHINLASYAEDKRRFEENMEKKNANGGGDSYNSGGNAKPASAAAPRGRGRPAAKAAAPAQEQDPSYQEEPASTSQGDDEPLF